MPGEIDPDQPSFIRYRLDEKDSSGYRCLGLGTKYDTFLGLFHSVYDGAVKED